MTREEDIIGIISNRFPKLKERTHIARKRRIFVDPPEAIFNEFCEFAYHELRFISLVSIVGTDEGENLGALYILAADDGILLAIRRYQPRSNPVMNTLTARFPNAEYYEKELVDMFGFRINGLPPGPRYPLPEDWPVGQYPLRKDWKPEMLNAVKEA